VWVVELGAAADRIVEVPVTPLWVLTSVAPEGQVPLVLLRRVAEYGEVPPDHVTVAEMVADCP
jgi:hypothetical protein